METRPLLGDGDRGGGGSGVQSSGRPEWHLWLDRTGRWLLAENQDSHSVAIFSIDPASGRLQPNGEKVEVGSPLCLFRHCGKPELKPPPFACAQFRTRKNLRGSLAGLA